MSQKIISKIKTATIVELEEWIDIWNKSYYLDGEDSARSVDDGVYDLAKSRLKELSPKSLFIDLVGTSLSSSNFQKVDHLKKMASLDNVFDVEEMTGWCEIFSKTQYEFDLWCEPKIDGVSFSAVFKNGILQYVLSRGDGSVGENITDNVCSIVNVFGKNKIPFPKKLKGGSPKIIELRGEIFFTTENFIALNKKLEDVGGKIFANPRNATAGSLRQKNSKITAERNLSYVFYSCGEATETMWKTQEDFVDKIKSWGLSVIEDFQNNETKRLVYRANNIGAVVDYFGALEKSRALLGLDIDGVVFKANSLELQNVAGETSHHPRWAIAWKFPAFGGSTILESVEFQVGRSGIITPVAKVSPVSIGGVFVASASLYNFEEIERLDLHIGDLVEVKRAGDVIPKIMKVLSHKSENIKIKKPKKCPECESDILEKSPAIFCSNKNCSGVKKEQLVYFVGSGGLDIDGFGESYIRLFYNRGWIATFSDIFTFIDRFKVDIHNEDGFADKRILALESSINSSKVARIEKFITAIGVPNVGEEMAIRIVQKLFDSSNIKPLEMLKKLQDVTAETLLEIDGVGEIVAKSWLDFFVENKMELEKLFSIVSPTIENKSLLKTDTILSNKRVVITGTLKEFSRDVLKERLRKLGVIVQATVSSKTDFLIVGDGDGNSAKFKKATKLGVKIIDENEIKDILLF
ncbi:MAG: NAD-dependent DNA ligase LigA [Alphaproteobacteria bacterium]|nr:NAD-dependent DNA ligase LigA [Alphaproteobacteria bacterium]MBL0718100.1 NAD-dependent DNA ligase LigA [Alphaproteobacteria bacterium]